MSNTAQSVSLIAAVLLSFFWASIPELRPFSVQITAGLFLSYFVVKHITQGGLRLNGLMPAGLTVETAILSTALLILIWYTGGISSTLLPLLYFILFLGIFVLDYGSLVLLVLLVPTFLWATATHDLSGHELGTLLSFLVMLPLVMFAKFQYQSAQDEKKEVEELESTDYDTVLFIKTYLRPKLEHLTKLSEYPEDNAENIKKQTTLLLEETEEHIRKL